jgi:transposase
MKVVVKKSGRITHGNKYLKSVLVQCAWAATRTKNTYLRAKYDSVIGKKGKKKALIIIGIKSFVPFIASLQPNNPIKIWAMNISKPTEN